MIALFTQVSGEPGPGQQEFYRAAIEAGGKDNGPPGPRPHYHEGYYAAFVLDPDGHNIEAVFHGSRPSPVAEL